VDIITAKYNELKMAVGVPLGNFVISNAKSTHQTKINRKELGWMDKIPYFFSSFFLIWQKWVVVTSVTTHFIVCGS
jgi:hypothetical protein